MVTWLNKLQARIGLLKDVVVGVHLRKNDKESSMILGLLESTSATIRTLPKNFPKLDPTSFDRGSPPISIIVSNYVAAAELKSAYKKLHVHLFINRQDLVAHTDKLLAAKSSLKRLLDNSADTKTTKKLKPKLIVPQLHAAQRDTESDPMDVDDDEVVDSTPTSLRTPPSNVSSIPSSSALNVSSSSPSSSNPASTAIQKQPTVVSSVGASGGDDKKTAFHSSPTAPSTSSFHSTDTSSSPSTAPSTSSSSSGPAPGAVLEASTSSSTSTTRPNRPARNAFASFFAKKPAPVDNSPFGSGISVASSSSSTRSLPLEQSTSRGPQLQPQGQQRRHANATFFSSVANWIPPPLVATDQLPKYLEFSANGPVLRLAFEATGFGEGAHLLSEWATYDGWTHLAECMEMAKEIVSRNFDGFCRALDDAVRAIVEQGLFVDGLTLFRKAIAHSEGKKTLTIPVNVEIPLNLPATYIRLFYLRPSEVAGLQTHLTNTAPKMSTRIAGVIQDGARFEWNGSTWVLYRYTGTTERWVLERVAEVGDQCQANLWEGARKDNVVYRTVDAVVSTAGPRPVSLAAQLMAELVLLIMLGPRNRINAIDQPQRPVYAIPRELLEACPKFTRDHPELWAHLPNCRKCCEELNFLLTQSRTVFFNLEPLPFHLGNRETHTQYLLRVLCFQLGISEHHAVVCYDLAPNRASNVANKVHTRLCVCVCRYN